MMTGVNLNKAEVKASVFGIPSPLSNKRQMVYTPIIFKKKYA